MIIELPFPAAELFPNRANGHHWSSRHAARAQARRIAALLTKAAALRSAFVPNDAPHYPIALAFEVTIDNKDLDGMLSAAKPQLDGVADGLGINDRQFRPITLTVKKTKGPQRLIMEIAQ